MPAAILWATVAAWFMLVGIALFELVRGWLETRRTSDPRWGRAAQPPAVD